MALCNSTSKDSSSIKVIDFGLAELFNPQQKPGTQLQRLLQPCCGYYRFWKEHFINCYQVILKYIKSYVISQLCFDCNSRTPAVSILPAWQTNARRSIQFCAYRWPACFEVCQLYWWYTLVHGPGSHTLSLPKKLRTRWNYVEFIFAHFQTSSPSATNNGIVVNLAQSSAVLRFFDSKWPWRQTFGAQ